MVWKSQWSSYSTILFEKHANGRRIRWRDSHYKLDSDSMGRQRIPRRNITSGTRWYLIPTRWCCTSSFAVSYWVFQRPFRGAMIKWSARCECPELLIPALWVLSKSCALLDLSNSIWYMRIEAKWTSFLSGVIWTRVPVSQTMCAHVSVSEC